MKKSLLITMLVYFAICQVAQGQQHFFDNIQIKDIKKDQESDWQPSQVLAKIITLSHQRFEIQLYDNLNRKTPTLSYEVRYNNSDSAVFQYIIIILNGVQLVNPGVGDFIETSTPLEDMAQGKSGTIAINEDILEEIVIYKME